MPGAIYTELANVAFEQHGYLTPEDAQALGVDPGYLRVLAKRGVLDHPTRGVFRLPLVPPGPLDEYMEAALWPRGGRGVLSHETALDLYELCDINPTQIHVTVPRAHRVQREVPARYAIHRADLPAADTTRWQGLPMVTVRRAIEDCIGIGVRQGLIDQAISAARDSARLTRKDADALRRLMADGSAA